MLSIEDYSIPDTFVSERSVSLRKAICAIQIDRSDNGEQRRGLLTELRSGTVAEIGGDGYNDRTIKVRANGHYYFVFRQDIEEVADGELV